MLNKTKTALSLVLCLLLTSILPTSWADETTVETPVLTFDQDDGYHATDSTLNLSGDSTFPLTSVEISIWNISMPDQWTEVTSSPYLDSVIPYTDVATESTMWSWQHSFNTTSIDCTCFVEISVMEQTDLISFGRVVYIGDEFHRPVLRPSLSSELNQAYSTQIYNSNLMNLSYDVLLPPSGLESTTTAGLNILPTVRICPVANGICLENYSVLSTTNIAFDSELELVVDVDENLLADGLYLLQVQIQDNYLTVSNNLTQYVIIDQSPPVVQLNAVESVFESLLVAVDIDVNDGYDGSNYVITWSITDPDGTPRSVADSGILADNRLVFNPSISGIYTVNALVRDLGGHLVIVSHNVTVKNLPPTATVRYDGFLIQNGSEITVPDTGDWVFTANDSFDSENDLSSLEYYWFVDGKTLLSGKSYLSSSDIQAATYREIRIEIIDNDGASSSLTFDVTQQETANSDRLDEVSFSSLISLFFILVVAAIVVMRHRAQSDTSSGFVKWTERGKEPKN